MYRYIKSDTTARVDTEWYRCVPTGKDVMKFRPIELGIHCGTLEQAEYFRDTKYQGSADIYKVIISDSVKVSDLIRDCDVWNAIEAITEILYKGFGVNISISEVTQDFRSGVLDKNKAAEYIKNVVGETLLVVEYNNEIEKQEKDIIILDSHCIVSTNLVN